MASDSIERLWARDTTLWKSDPAVGEKIRHRLGWLDAPRNMRNQAARIQHFAALVKEARFSHALLLGMGGSSLCPEVCRNVYGVAPGYPDLRVIDTTDPAAIARFTRSVDLEHTLFINASKSGTTLESASLAAYFWDKRPHGDQFIAITDPGTVLDKEGELKKFRQVFRNAADIGGRYAALSFFGLVPAALLGVDIGELLARAEEAVCANQPGSPPGGMNGVALGATLGGLASQGRNKLTFVMSPKIADFGNWVEQLVAESTGKEGKGIVPVAGEPLGAPEVYGDDRTFVAMGLEGDRIDGLDAKRAALERAGHPFLMLVLKDTLDLGAEFFRWEVATAMAGAVLNINPFDELNVTESKENTARLLKAHQSEGRLPEVAPSKPADLPSFLQQGCVGDYIAILAFIERRAETIEQLGRIQHALRDSTRLATTVGFGPRYLHSTGQLHKGGPNTGLFILLTADDVEDVPIPGRPYSFGTLKRAQALGDLEALRNHGRRVIHLHLGKDLAAGLEELERVVTRQGHAAS
jgi:glucose-6-phosphate isomerase